MKSECFRIFAYVVPVRGYVRSSLYDLNDNLLYFVPNLLVDVVEALKTRTISDVLQDYKETESFVEEYIHFLLQKQLGFHCNFDDLQHFPDLNLQWDSPFPIENILLDIDADSNHIDDELVDVVKDLRIPVVQIRVYSCIADQFINDLISKLHDSATKNIELILPFSLYLTEAWCASVVNRFPKVRMLIIHSCSYTKSIDIEDVTVFFTTQRITSENDCGIIEQESFVVDMKMFTEGQLYNTCLNRKLSIDKKGNIKNCPSLDHSYGRDYSKIPEIIQTNNFQKYGRINKDKIEVCKICEYRFACTDCRAYLYDCKSEFCQPRKCTYNPFIAKWEDENGYVPVNACGYYSEHGEFKEDKEKIRQINSKLWE